MTRKRKIYCKKKPTKLLFINSNSVNTYSKTYSHASQFCTKSLIMQLKQKLPKTKYYEDQGTTKRDLSIETDICILRRYYKKNRNKLLNRGAVSAKSKYSINHTEIDTINEFERDSSACGDSELTNDKEIKRYNINLTSLVVNNLKKLLNDWIKKYLLENNQTKQKIDSVLDSILHRLDFQNNDTSSCTYTVDVELGDQTSKPGSLSTVSKNMKFKPEEGVKDLKRHRSSYLTIPLKSKYLQVISTLSIPRKQKGNNRNESKSLHKIKKFRHKKILLSISKSSKYLLRSSSLDFLTLRTKSLTKRCATYQRNEREIVNDSNNVFMQKSYYNNNSLDNYISDKTVCAKSIHLHDTKVLNGNSKNIPSIYKNMYGITPSHIISYESTNTGSKTCSNITDDQGRNIRISPKRNVQQNQKIIDEYEQSDQLVAIDFGKHSSDMSKLDIKFQNKLKSKKKRSKKNKIRYNKINIFNRKISKFQTYKSIKCKQFTYLFRKSNNKIKIEKDLLKQFQGILKYLSNYEKKKDIQLHIQISVGPVDGNKENTTTKSNKKFDDSNIREENINEKDITKTTPSNGQNIISLLDGATSQSKYIVSRETSTDLFKKTGENYIQVLDNQIDNSKISQEISELRGIIQSLATTAEKLVSDHLCNSSFVKNESSDGKNDFPVNIKLQHAIEKSLIDSAVEKHSKGNQVSNNVSKIQKKSGLKIRKEPKIKGYNPRLIKKNTSYNVIASESVMKITDMTSAAQNIITYGTMLDEALNCSLPKSKSLFEIAIGRNKRKLLAFYCDDFMNPAECIYDGCERSAPCSSSPRRPHCHSVHPECIYSRCSQNVCCDDDTCSGEPQYTCTGIIPVCEECDLIDDCNTCSSVCINIDKTRNKKVTIRNRYGVGFWEGCLYCVLLWIPVMLISWLFYIYVIKELIVPRDDAIHGKNNLPPGKFLKEEGKNADHAYRSIIRSLTLSDLGF